MPRGRDSSEAEGSFEGKGIAFREGLEYHRSVATLVFIVYRNAPLHLVKRSIQRIEGRMLNLEHGTTKFCIPIERKESADRF
jgi:hypothetical protein